MKQIILSTVSLAQSWLVEDLLDVLNQEKRVFVLTCIREEFQMIGESVEVLSQKEIARSLLRYGVLKSLTNFDVFLHYIESLESLRSILNVLEDKDRLVIALGENAGFIDEEGELFPLGDAYLFQPTQIDELYEAYHTYQES